MEDKEHFLKGLEKDHANIVKLLNGLEAILKDGRISDAAATFKTINYLKNILTKHLKREDKIFYPDMRKRATQVRQDALLPALDVFIEDMNKISQNVSGFFARYEKEDDISADGKDFISGVKKIRDALIKRIATEEKTLYCIYKAYYNI